TNLDYLGARFFSSGMGRFTRPDDSFAGADLANPQSWNLYAYALNNPLRYVDPTGHDQNCPQNVDFCTSVTGEDPFERFIKESLWERFFRDIWSDPNIYPRHTQ